MPTIGGVSVSWDNSTPQDNESAGLGDDRIRSLKTSLQQALDAEHNFPSGGGANVGYHAFGSARAFYGVQSNVSSSGSDGRLMLTSDTSQFFAVGSGGTVLLGGWNSLSVGSAAGISWPQRAYWAMEIGEDKTTGSFTKTVTFPNSGYSGRPFVLVAPGPQTDVTQVELPFITGIGATTFTVRSVTTTGAAASDASFQWMSVGTRAL